MNDKTINALVPGGGLVRLPLDKRTFMLQRHGEGLTTDGMKEVLKLIKDYYHKFPFPEYEETVQLWQYVLREYTKEQVIWGLRQYIEKNQFPPQANELREICEAERRKQGVCFFEAFRAVGNLIDRVEAGRSKHVQESLIGSGKVKKVGQSFFTICYGWKYLNESRIREFMEKVWENIGTDETRPLYKIIEEVEYE